MIGMEIELFADDGVPAGVDSSGKKANGEVYLYRYHTCRTASRVGGRAGESQGV